MAKSCLESSLSVTTVERHRVIQFKSVVHFTLSITAENVAKKGHVARKCMSKPQNVNALDDSVSDDGQETYHLFTLDTHSVQKGKKFVSNFRLGFGRKIS